MNQAILLADDVLQSIPSGLRNPLISTYNEIVKNYQENRWEPSELNGGKFCEIVISILQGYVGSSFPSSPAKPSNMVDACRDLERADKTRFSQAVRITIPRLLIAIFDFRNNRGVGHAGADVNPNHMDAGFVLAASKWILGDLIRVFHNVDLKTATDAVNAVTERTNPIVWSVGAKKRVLRPGLSMKDKTLLLLHATAGSVSETALRDWVEYSNPSIYRRDVLRRAHEEKLIEYEKSTGFVTISPLGIKYVESRLL